VSLAPLRHRRTGRYVTEGDAIAYHEAAHAVVAEVLGVRVAYVTVEDDGDDDQDDGDAVFPATVFTAASNWLAPFVNGDRAWRRVGKTRRAFVEAHLVSTWAGIIAERFLLKRAPYRFWRIDNDDAWQAVAFAALLGAPSSKLRAFAYSYGAPARRLVERRWPAIEAVAQALLWHGELTGRDLRALIRRYPPASAPSRARNGRASE
jgi:hypothetical protein